jgi:glycosyltransferase involved in cell wall biosynthesis
MTVPSQREPPHLSGISAVFPAFNDGGTIPSMILTALMALRQVTGDYEIIVTEDGSSDYTAQVLEEMRSRYPELRLVHHKTNLGYGAALRSGFSAACKEWVFYTDGDAQYNPLALVDLVAAVRSDVDVVNGYQITRHDPLERRMIGGFYNLFVKWAFGLKLRDVDCDFRLIRRKLFQEIELESTTGTLPLELVKKFQDAGCMFVEVPVHHYFRQYGVSQFFNWRRLWATVIHLVQLWWKLVIRKEHLHSRK